MTHNRRFERGMGSRRGSGRWPRSFPRRLPLLLGCVAAGQPVKEVHAMMVGSFRYLEQ